MDISEDCGVLFHRLSGDERRVLTGGRLNNLFQEHLSFLLSVSQSASTLFGLSSEAVELKGLG